MTSGQFAGWKIVLTSCHMRCARRNLASQGLLPALGLRRAEVKDPGLRGCARRFAKDANSTRFYSVHPGLSLLIVLKL